MLGFVQYDDPCDDEALAKAAQQLRAHYRPVLGDTISVRTRWFPHLRTGVIAIDDNASEESLSDLIVWGCPVSATGVASDTELTSALADPVAHARDLTGYFCLAKLSPDDIRVVTSATTIHSLKRVRGAKATAWATRGWAAHILVDRKPTLNRDAIAEFVHMDYVLGTDELLTDTVVLRDAHVVDVAPTGVREWSYWPLAERIAPTKETTPEAVRRLVTDAVLPFVNVPNVWLGLTGGRDSTLIASCVGAAGGRLDSFTFGPRLFPDVRAARAMAKRLDWPHTVVTSRLSSPDWARLARFSAWTEGLQSGSSTLLDREYNWRVTDVVWLVGFGGEIARAWYWAHSGNPTGWVEEYHGNIRKRFAPGNADTFIGRLDANLDDVRALGGTAANLPDHFYTTVRMHKWAGRVLPVKQIGNFLPACFAPAVIQGFLNIPLEQRRTSATYDAAIALGPEPLREIALRAAFSHPRVLGFLGRHAQRQQDELLTTLLTTTPHEPVTRATLGQEWWDKTLARVSNPGGIRRQAWNAVAVEALALALGE